MVAFIFNLMTLFIIHINFYKYYNNLFNLKRSVIYYLLIFFLFVRMDVLNSIHSFNSFSVLNNFNSFLVISILLFIILSLNSIKFFLKKYAFNNYKLIPILSIFFKLINSLFFFYFFLNLYYVLYYNYQFIDVTKYLKLALLILCYLTFKLEFIQINFFFCVVFLFFFKLTEVFNFLIFLNLITLYSKYSWSVKYKILYIIHTLFLIFVLYIVYNNQFFYKDVNNLLKLNFNVIVSNIFQFFKNDCILLNDFTVLNSNLNNFVFNTGFNNFFYKVNIFINNCTVTNSNINIYYNVDNILCLFLYKFNYIFYFLIYLSLLILLV